ncbi:hypothetical protein [Erythrobacter sp. JK5]|uniref:hypothetical protein n=1 Tax=Erythrobacter sp. JK5 TaxID=2829500 RepID=UPI001BA92DE8|nr:hypothetical protein [Erythrobacter sp. JK5]QUL37942.1 hypothetical protein KDC96_00440 [Erythrobacter sp. JK5]
MGRVLEPGGADLARGERNPGFDALCVECSDQNFVTPDVRSCLPQRIRINPATQRLIKKCAQKIDRQSGHGVRTCM